MFKQTILFHAILSALFVISSCSKPSNTPSNKPLPAVLISQTPLTIYLPNNCPQSFIIKNIGAPGSILNYTVADDGALGGFLTVNSKGGSIGAGESAVIGISIMGRFVNSSPTLIGATLVVNVYTPDATNYKKIPVPVYVKNIDDISLYLIGTWTGTWAGQSYFNAPNNQQSVPINGTWTLNIATVDTIKKTVTGSLNWTGTDAAWTPNFDPQGNIISGTPGLILIDTTINLSHAFNTFNFNVSTGANQNVCSQSGINLTIDPVDYSLIGKPPGYGPKFVATFDINSNIVSSLPGDGFISHPFPNYGKALSTGAITGKKQ
jgi:hypothetical protein